MVTNSFRQPFRMLLGDLWRPLVPILSYILVVSWLDIQFHLEDFNFPVPVVAILGTVIGIVLAFRTNSGYGRWWEARILWGAIVNDSRTWTRQLLEFTGAGENAPTGYQTGTAVAEEVVDTIGRMSHRQAAWCYALARTLRGQNPLEDLSGLLDAEELHSYSQSLHVPNDLLLRQAIELRQLHQRGQLELFQWVELERTLTRLTNSMGGCERIKNTPFPLSYSRIVDTCIYVFVFFLPFSLVNVPSAALIVTSLTLSLSFLLIERVAIYLEDPFHNYPTDTPMLALSRTIEINLRQMLGEDNLPPKCESVDGVLM